jgi:4-hydroxythreonine-4-phosphate dehydrogenase
MHLGQPTKQSGQTALAALAHARTMLKRYQDAVLVTAPIAKEACSMAGSEFHGHTEMLASWDNTNQFMMIFSSKAMRGGLVTIHEPLRMVPKLLTRKLIEEKIAVATRSLHLDFGIKQPSVAVLGLNPHAGENGILGTEELQIFKAVIAKHGLSGPFPADAFFANKAYKNFDFILSPYHDQLLIPFKMLSWKDGVNYTAGLTFIRTSPDHGVAYDIAGKGKANAESMHSAIQLARKIYQNRKKFS